MKMKQTTTFQTKSEDERERVLGRNASRENSRNWARVPIISIVEQSSPEKA